MASLDRLATRQRILEQNGGAGSLAAAAAAAADRNGSTENGGGGGVSTNIYSVRSVKKEEGRNMMRLNELRCACAVSQTARLCFLHGVFCFVCLVD